MKALSLTQPWATLVALGEKKIETRGWFTNYRGPFAIASSKSFPKDCRDLCFDEPFRSIFEKHNLGLSDLPLGQVLCIVTLTECVRMTYDNMPPENSNEYAFGHYAPGRYMLKMMQRLVLPVPVPCKGALGFWEWDPKDHVPDYGPSPIQNLVAEKFGHQRLDLNG